MGGVVRLNFNGDSLPVEGLHKDLDRHHVATLSYHAYGNCGYECDAVLVLSMLEPKMQRKSRTVQLPEYVKALPSSR